MSVRSKYREQTVYPMGEYKAKLVSVDEGEPGEFGPVWKWTFALTEPQYNGAEITAISSQTYSNRSKAYKWATSLGHPAKTDFDASQIEGRNCRLALIVEKDDDGTEYNKIQAIGRATKTQTQAPLPPPEAPPEEDDFPF